MDIFGKALLDFQSGNYNEDIKTYSSLGEEDIMPIPYLFRNFGSMPKLEQVALENCKGKVLDIGCGAGSHSLHLQQSGFDITALDSSQRAITVCKDRGINQTVHANIIDYSAAKFDTLLLLMNGIGIVGNLSGLKTFLKQVAQLLRKGGCILLDSSDIVYMFETEEGGYDFSDSEVYYGEVKFTIEYQGEKSKEFNWLYVDFNTLCTIAKEADFKCELLFQGNNYDYLAKLYLAKY